MLIDLKMCRFETAPWGFRLIGGADFEVPLTVVKVTEGSIAEQAGMKVGDIIVRINEEATSNMTHTDAHQVISKCGNNFFFGVIREEPNEDVEYCEELQVSQRTEDNLTDSIAECNEGLLETTVEISDSNVSFEAQAQNSESYHEENMTEEVIAEIMSGEAEVLKDHNIIGVNFNRIFPKAGVCQSSEVFRHLNEDAIKTKIEMEKEKRKWTTFLQKPDRPVPKDKKTVEEQATSEPYKVRIVKQPKPKVDPDRVPTPPPEPEPEIEQEINQLEKTQIEEELVEPPTDSEVPNLESDVKTINDDDDSGQIIVNEDSTIEKVNDVEEITVKNEDDDLNKENESRSVEVAIVEKTEEELILEKQLSDVQKQLLALSSLPSTIQATLDSVTKQLAELLPTFKLQPQMNLIATLATEEKQLSQEQVPISEISGRQQNIDTSGEENAEDERITTEEINETNVLPEMTSAEDVIVDNEREQKEEVRPISPIPEEIEQNQLKEEHRKIQEELQYKKQKEQHEQLQEELQQRLIRNRPSRRPPRAFGPLTPQERPLVLPGGRRWRKPKDAYNDEFIAEILSSQAELITGTTLGSTYESPLLGYDEREHNLLYIPDRLDKRVNFLKYQKPEKKIDLEKSEVYKVIHHLDREPKRGIPARPPRVLAEEDVRTSKIMSVFSIVPLHHHPELTQQCCNLINSEWSRSDTARLRSLEASCDTLPVNLILINQNMHRVIGHCKISSINSKKRCCFVESVVVDEQFRGKGLGKIIMKGAEDYCKNRLQLKAVYLATIGQEGFYEKLGYEYCPPVLEFEPRCQQWACLQNSNRRYMRKFL